MKTVQRYECDYCHTIYATEEECRYCESKHVYVEAVDPEYEAGEKCPRRVTVRFNDGSTHRYLDEDYI